MVRLLAAFLVMVPILALAEEIDWQNDGANGWGTGDRWDADNINEVKTEVDDNAADIDALQALDTVSEMETAEGVNVLLETEIDASAELRALMDDESGDGALLFQNGDLGDATGTSISLDAAGAPEMRMTSSAGSDQIAITMDDNGSTTDMNFFVDDNTGDDQKYMEFNGAAGLIIGYKDIALLNSNVNSGYAATETSSGGTVAQNFYHLITTSTVDRDLPDCTADTVGYIVHMTTKTALSFSVGLADSGDTIHYPGATLGADDELDSPGNAFDSITFRCLEADGWYVTSVTGGTWTDGGPAD